MTDTIPETSPNTETTPAVPENSVAELMAIGRRDFICNDFENAVDNLSKCCEKLTQEFGEEAVETAEGYFWYAKALWENSRGKNDFLGEEAENDDVKPLETKLETHVEEPEEEQNSAEKEAIPESQNASKDVVNAGEIEAEKAPEKETEMAENGDAPAENAEGEDGEDADEEEEDEDEISDHQLAYEMFELARSIYEKQPTSTEIQTKKSEIYLNLGEITGENGQIEEAIEEYQKALKILTDDSIFDEQTKNQRRIAEVYFSLGCSFDAIRVTRGM